MTGRYPASVVGDSAYGSQENYAFLEEHRIGNYLKYNTFHLEQKKKYNRNFYRKEHFRYDTSSDTYICPQGRSMIFKETKFHKTMND